MEGMNMDEIADLRRQTPLDCFFDILIEEECKVEALFFGMKKENLEEILSKPYTMVGSDASARAVKGPLGRGRPHPRTFGTFPLIFERFVNDGILKLEEAVFKMTGLPAGKLNLSDRGLIRTGAAADLVVFGPGRIRSRVDSGPAGR